MKSDIVIVVIHDNLKEHSYLLTKLREDFERVVLIDDPDGGIKYVSDHNSEKIIVVLDIDFGDGVTNGYQVLNEIRKKSFLIEVIILSASDLPDGKIMDRIPELVELSPSDYVIRGKPDWQDTLIKSVVKAREKMDNSIGGAIEEWITIQAERKRSEPFIVSAYGKEYTLNDILKEVRLQTEFGRQFGKDLLTLTIDRLIRGKEKLG